MTYTEWDINTSNWSAKSTTFGYHYDNDGNIKEEK